MNNKMKEYLLLGINNIVLKIQKLNQVINIKEVNRRMLRKKKNKKMSIKRNKMKMTVKKIALAAVNVVIVRLDQ